MKRFSILVGALLAIQSASAQTSPAPTAASAPGEKFNILSDGAERVPQLPETELTPAMIRQMAGAGLRVTDDRLLQVLRRDVDGAIHSLCGPQSTQQERIRLNRLQSALENLDRFFSAADRGKPKYDLGVKSGEIIDTTLAAMLRMGAIEPLFSQVQTVTPAYAGTTGQISDTLAQVILDNLRLQRVLLERLQQMDERLTKLEAARRK